MHFPADSPGATDPRLWTQERLRHLIESRLGERQLIVVANREPFIHCRRGDRIECLQPASGMAAALHPILMASGGTWIAHGSGDADRATVDAHDHIAVPPDDPAYTLRRVWLTREQEQGFYYGLANEGLWPLCHITFTRPVFRPQDWAAYREVNRRFAEAVLEEAAGRPSFVFVQDYHFCLLPQMLREMGAEHLTIAQFWHIPWPNRETFRSFPWGEELLRGLLGNDLLGFHVRHHCQNFIETVERTLETRVDPESWQIAHAGRHTLVRDFPISIDFTAHEELAAGPEVARAMDVWRESLPLEGRYLGVGIERLDYTKGIPDRLRAFDYLLETHPELRGRILFTQIAVPSRSHLAAYRAVEEEVDALTRAVNERWGTPTWQPVVLLKKHLPPVEMMALHRLAHFCVVNSLHDGMNLVAKEFVASRADCDGALILSRFTGACRELESALCVNPFDVEQTAAAMHHAITMPPVERLGRMHRLRAQVATHNVYRWAGRILSQLFRLEACRSDSAPSRTSSLVFTP